MSPASSERRVLVKLWTVLLIAPVAWSAALGILFALLDESCAQGSRQAMLLAAAVCVLLTILPAPLAWNWRRHFDAGSVGAERARFMLEVACGASVIFALTTLLTAVPVFLLSACPS